MTSRFLSPFVFAFALAVAAVSLAPATTAQGAGATAAWSHGGVIDGLWDSNIGAVYEITQHGQKFVWWSARLQETAMGVVQGTQIRATWSGINGAGSGVAVIKVFDRAGRARRIEWSNGVIFTR